MQDFAQEHSDCGSVGLTTPRRVHYQHTNLRFLNNRYATPHLVSETLTYPLAVPPQIVELQLGLPRLPV